MKNLHSLEHIKLTASLRTGLIDLTPGTVIPSGNVILLSNSWIISHPLIIAEDMFITQPTRSIMGVEIGILMVGDLIIEGNGMQDVLQYSQKPKVVIRQGGVIQFIIQEISYLKGKTNNELPWELAVSPVPTKTIVRIN